MYIPWKDGRLSWLSWLIEYRGDAVTVGIFKKTANPLTVFLIDKHKHCKVYLIEELRPFNVFVLFFFFTCSGFTGTISALAGTLHKSTKTDKNAKRFHLVRFYSVPLTLFLPKSKTYCHLSCLFSDEKLCNVNTVDRIMMLDRFWI